MGINESPEIAVNTLASQTIPKEKQLSREQRRRLERLQQEANVAFYNITQKFLDFLIQHDNPDDESVKAKINLLSAQWKIFCRGRSIHQRFFNNVYDSCYNQYKEFKDLRDGSSK